MSAREFIKEGLMVRDRSNVDDIQFQVLLHLEEDEPLAVDIEKKIDRITTKYGFRRMEFLCSVVTDQVAATVLAKDAGRQKLAEALQIKYLNDVRKFSIKKLDDNSHQSIRLDNGEFVVGREYNNLTATKSMDAINEVAHDYLSFKYTDEAGGGQYYQVKDICKFLKEALKYTEKHDDNTVFTAIVDGNYIVSHIPQLSAFTSDRVRVCTSDTYTSLAQMCA